jgi:hypothetical protein
MLNGQQLKLKSLAWVLGGIALTAILVLANIVAIQGHEDRVLER